MTAFWLSLCLAQLSLFNNQIGTAGTADLAKALAVNRTLTAVCCALCNLRQHIAERGALDDRCLHNAFSFVWRSSGSATTRSTMWELWS